MLAYTADHLLEKYTAILERRARQTNLLWPFSSATIHERAAGARALKIKRDAGQLVRSGISFFHNG